MTVKLYANAEEYTCDEDNLLLVTEIDSEYPPVIVIWQRDGYTYYDDISDEKNKICRYVQAYTFYLPND